MRTVTISSIPFFFLAAIVLWPCFASGQENAASIIQYSAEANERDWAAVREFDNFERDRTKDGDKTYYHRLSGEKYGVIGIKGPGRARKLVKVGTR